MQRHNFLAASAVGVAASLAGAGLAFAQVPTQAPMQPMQGRSNQSIREAYGRVAELIDELGLDEHDYKGHRVAAIAQLNTAKSQLLEALKVRRETERSQGSSNASIEYAQRAVERIIDNLQRDASDYGGHRLTAIADLRTAQSDLQQAISSR
ncbi:MAG: hypothetical protein GIX03_05495 [Candidatus Eremiobacteraeota bacterium]|nr:hypothetical protein [Candidatus Eremiobacteraeota bacterium]MBC5802451.1 hypothetical protein [Candidatus Eremiobacteraeota bacterium]MBC5820474.1 hypothetical protein [Candidatus Eremiobacteraeota bacterium]